jgi:hypothetical protein
MRIVLDISEGPDDVRVATASGQTAVAASEPAAVDAGAGPGVVGPDGSGSASSDVGPPPRLAARGGRGGGAGREPDLDRVVR